MGYAKLFSSITESSLWSEPKEVRLLFVTMLAKANSVGFVEAAVPGLARVANLSQEEVEKALEVLSGPDIHSKNQDLGGARVVSAPGGFMVVNFEDYRNRTTEEERKEYMREYMREYRASRKHDVNKVKKSKEFPSASASASASDKKGDARGKQIELPESLNNEAFLAAWEDWQRHRREIKKPLTTTSMKGQLEEFEKWGAERSIAAIRYTIRKGWQGLSEPEARTGAAPGQRAMSFEERKRKIGKVRQERNDMFKMKDEDNREFTAQETEQYRKLTAQLKELEGE